MELGHPEGVQSGATPQEFSGHVHQGGDPRVDPELSGEIAYLFWPGNASGSSGRTWKCCWEVENTLLNLVVR